MSIRPAITFLLVLISVCSHAEVRIRLLYSEPTSQALIRIHDNSHSIQFNNGQLKSLKPNQLILLSRAGEKVAVTLHGEVSVLVDSVSIISSEMDSYVELSVEGVLTTGKEYTGKLSISSNLGVLWIINTLDLEKYLGGVVQAEGGYKGHPEYFKAQAVIARTYAYQHFTKHANEGYHLCDDVHCQAYKGRSLTELIGQAVAKTMDQVICDSDSNLILAPFHSNCGGQTMNSGDVWLISLPYLKSVIDPYCGYSRNAVWEKTIPESEWLGVLKTHGELEADTTHNLNFLQVSRMAKYNYKNIQIPLVSLRTEFNLRSTLFSIKDEGENLKLSGKGYGHGVGLCQEGAMVMAKRGFTSSQIISFYYKDVFLININNVKHPERLELSF